MFRTKLTGYGNADITITHTMKPYLHIVESRFER